MTVSAVRAHEFKSKRRNSERAGCVRAAGGQLLSSPRHQTRMGAATGLRRGVYASSTLAEPRLRGQLGRRRLEDTDADKVEAIVAARAGDRDP
jgi:hypothetical protein